MILILEKEETRTAEVKIRSNAQKKGGRVFIELPAEHRVVSSFLPALQNAATHDEYAAFFTISELVPQK